MKKNIPNPCKEIDLGNHSPKDIDLIEELKARIQNLEEKLDYICNLNDLKKYEDY